MPASAGEASATGSTGTPSASPGSSPRRHSRRYTRAAIRASTKPTSSSVGSGRNSSALLEKLAALIPRPRINLVLYHGVLASHAGWRARVVAYRAPLGPPVVASPGPDADDTSTRAPGVRHWAWADLMRRAFDIDVLACPRCGGRLRLIATVKDPGAERTILGAFAGSAGLVGRAPPRLAARAASEAVASGA